MILRYWYDPDTGETVWTVPPAGGLCGLLLPVLSRQGCQLNCGSKETDMISDLDIMGDSIATLSSNAKAGQPVSFSSLDLL